MSTFMLEVAYDFNLKEIMIEFEHAEQAKAYQRKNGEARILEGQATCVWLPVPPSMTRIRASSDYGLVLCFTDEDAALAWRNKSVIGRMYRSRKDSRAVYIERNLTGPDLNGKLGLGAFAGNDRLDAPIARQAKDRSPNRVVTNAKDDAGFGIQPREASKTDDEYRARYFRGR